MRKLDYSIQISKLFYERFIKNGEISLFSPNDVPGLYDAFGTDDFDTLYRKYESDDLFQERLSGTRIISRPSKRKGRDWSSLYYEH